MGIALAVAAILSAIVQTLAAVAGAFWWTYRQGQASREEKARREVDEHSQAEARAKIEELERLLTETRVELALMQHARQRPTTVGQDRDGAPQVRRWLIRDR